MFSIVNVCWWCILVKEVLTKPIQLEKKPQIFVTGKYVTKIQLHLFLIWISLIKLYYCLDFFFKCTLEFSFKSSIRRRCVWDWNDETILRHFDSELKDIFVIWAHLLIFLRTLFRLLVVSLTFPANTNTGKEFS